MSTPARPLCLNARSHARALLLLAASAFLMLAAPARAGVWDTIKKTSDGIKKTKEGIEKADRVTTKTKRLVKSVKGFPLEQEIALGDSVALEIIGRNGGIWQDEEATRRVNLVGKALARYCDRQELAWVFGILDSDTINAYSAPGGRVFITRGLYSLTRDDDELAGVLAHEITHIVRRHALNSLRRGELLASSLDLAGEVTNDPNGYASDIDTIMSTLFENGFDPSTEYGADAGGVDLCVHAGYDRGSLRAVLEAIAARPRDGTWKPSDVFATHPPLSTRITRLPKRVTAPGSAPADAIAEPHEHEVPPGAKFCPTCGKQVQQ